MKKKSKILILGSSHPSSLENMYYTAIKKIDKSEVYLFDLNFNNFIKKVFSFFSFNEILYRKSIINFFKEYNDYFDIILIFKGMELDRHTMSVIKEASSSSKWINIYTDDPFNTKLKSASNENVLDVFDMFDFICTWSRDIEKKLKKKFTNKIIYLPFAFDNLINFRKKSFNSKNKNILFYGSYDADRENILNYIADYEVNIYGNNWSKNNLKNLDNFNINYKDIYQKDLASAIFKSNLVLNLLRRQVGNAHNMRTFEIPGYNGLMLTERTKEQNFFFPENQACFMFSNKDEMLTKIDYILSNKKKIIKIKDEGYKIAKEHTYVKRVNYLLNKF